MYSNYHNNVDDGGGGATILVINIIFIMQHIILIRMTCSIVLCTKNANITTCSRRNTKNADFSVIRSNSECQ